MIRPTFRNYTCTILLSKLQASVVEEQATKGHSVPLRLKIETSKSRRTEKTLERTGISIVLGVR